MKTWLQRPPQTKLDPSPSDEFHGCLDALIVTIRALKQSLHVMRYGGPVGLSLDQAAILEIDIRSAEERAAICAGLLFDRWIEETVEQDFHPPECRNCHRNVNPKFYY